MLAWVIFPRAASARVLNARIKYALKYVIITYLPAGFVDDLLKQYLQFPYYVVGVNKQNTYKKHYTLIGIVLIVTILFPIYECKETSKSECD